MGAASLRGVEHNQCKNVRHSLSPPLNHRLGEALLPLVESVTE